MTRYELLDRIGVGGMAEIFRGKAVAAGGFEKPVAIKRILPHLSQDPRFVELLIAEAKVLSLLKHRNIVQIFDVGLGDDGKYFLVMEFVDGKDIGAVQRGLEAHRRRMPFDLVLHIGAEICEALEHAHSARAPDGKPMSLVHRDVSPSNVLLSRAGEIKLTDFGIAKRAEQETGHGAVRGKFAYISPEQARNEHLDPRSDVFSVGILLWELVTSQRLFSSLSDLEALRQVRNPSIQRPTEIDRSLPKTIDSIIMGALAKDAAQRYATAGQFGADLRALRYSLDVTVGDPATELAKIIDTAEEVERASSHKISRPSAGFDLEPSEMTAFRIRTADAFSQRDVDGSSIIQARAVIDRFEEEETRLAQLSGDQMRILRNATPFRDSGELTAAASPRPNRATDEQTVARAPLSVDDLPTYPPNPPAHEPQSGEDLTTFPPVNQRFDADEDTRLVAPRDRRTPVPERNTHRPPPSAMPVLTAPPPTPPPLVRSRGPTPGPPMSRDPASANARAQNPLPGLPPPINGPTLLGPPPIPLGPPPSTSTEHTPPPGTVHGRSQSEPSVRPQPILPAPVPAPAPVMAPPPSRPLSPQPPPPSAPSLPPMLASSYPAWEPPKRPPSPILEDRASHKSISPPKSKPRPASRASMQHIKSSKQAIKPWMLVVGAVVMAGLAFAVTRACIHPTARAAAEIKPATP